LAVLIVGISNRECDSHMTAMNNDHVDQKHGEVEKGHRERVRFDLPDWLV